MKSWNQRSREEARLFNPSFLGTLVWATAVGYKATASSSLPVALAYVSLPISLHKPTREGLPRSIRTSLATWLLENSYFRVGFAGRARALAPYVREGLLFGSTHGLVSLAPDMGLLAAPRPTALPAYLRQATDEVRQCLKRSEFVGKWFGTAGTAETVMALWGVTP